eukprot:15117987-Alexandrium_andersonii.AAC.1
MGHSTCMPSAASAACELSSPLQPLASCQRSSDAVTKMVLGKRSCSTHARAPAEPRAELARAFRLGLPVGVHGGQAAVAQSSSAAPPAPARSR